MRFSSIVGFGSLLWAVTVTASQCRPSHASVSSASSVSSSSAAASSSAPPTLPPCYTNLLGSNYRPDAVSASSNVAISYPSSCSNSPPNTCVNFVDAGGDPGSFSFSVTLPTVAGTYYAFYTFIRVAGPTTDSLTCTVSNSASSKVFALHDGQAALLNFLTSAGSTSTVTCSCDVSAALDFTASAFSIVSTDPNAGGCAL